MQNHKNTTVQLRILTDRINKLIAEENHLNKKAEEIENTI